MFRLSAAAKGIGFFDERPDKLPQFIHTDEKRLRQILINLLSNAIKYTDRGSATLRIRLRGQVAEFAVIDTGHGIRPEDIETIFEPFERGHMAAANAVPGTGLGLTISKLLTQILGGEISVESTPGKGSIFRVRMLLSEAAGGPVAAPERRFTGYAGPRKRLLIADDDTDHVDFLSEILRPLGFILFTARDGATCLTLAEDTLPDLVILDIAMPGMSGIEAASKLRAKLPDAKIMFLSGNFHDAPRLKNPDQKQDYDAFLAKPTDVRALLEKLRLLMDISWIYEAPKPLGKAASPQTMTRPSEKHLVDLLRLGRIGYVRGIESKLTEIEQAEPGAKDFCAYLRDLLRGFELARYMECLETLPERAGDD
jgi:CheY-like chemotaxis protein/anti-sigma regulatory factor (Ser/Thr protein kinase)